MKANEFDKNFDEGDDIQDVLDLSKAKRNTWREPIMTAKSSAEEKAIAEDVKSNKAVSIDPENPASLPEGRVDFNRLDAATERDIAAQQRMDETNALLDIESRSRTGYIPDPA